MNVGEILDVQILDAQILGAQRSDDCFEVRGVLREHLSQFHRYFQLATPRTKVELQELVSVDDGNKNCAISQASVCDCRSSPEIVVSFRFDKDSELVRKVLLLLRHSSEESRFSTGKKTKGQNFTHGNVLTTWSSLAETALGNDVLQDGAPPRVETGHCAVRNGIADSLEESSAGNTQFMPTTILVHERKIETPRPLLTFWSYLYKCPGLNYPLRGFVLLLTTQCQLIERNRMWKDVSRLRPIFCEFFHLCKGLHCYSAKLPEELNIQNARCQVPCSTKKEAKERASLDACLRLLGVDYVVEFVLGRSLKKRRRLERFGANALRKAQRRYKKAHAMLKPAIIIDPMSFPLEVNMYLITETRWVIDFHKEGPAFCHNLLVPERKLHPEDFRALEFPHGSVILGVRFVKALLLNLSQYNAITEFCKRVKIISANDISCQEGDNNNARSPGFLFAPLCADERDGFRIAWEEIIALNTYNFRSQDWAHSRGSAKISSRKSVIVQCRYDDGQKFYHTLRRDEAAARPIPDEETSLVQDCSQKYPDAEVKSKARKVIRIVEQNAWHELAWCVLRENCRRVPVRRHTIDLVRDLTLWHCFVVVKNIYRQFASCMSNCDVICFVSALTKDRTQYHHKNERLEWLGDTVLEVFVSIYLTLDERLDGEAKFLQAMKSKIVSNKNLSKTAKCNYLGLAVRLLCLDRTVRSNPYFLAPQKPWKNTSEKKLADAVEALIGLNYLKNGFHFIPRFLDLLGLTENLEYLMRTCPTKPLLDSESFPGSDRLQDVEGILGYAFENKALLMEALTHGSFVCAKMSHRLDFVGTAALYFIISDGLFREHPHLSAGDLSLVRLSVTSYEFYARALIHLSLHKYLYCANRMDEMAQTSANDLRKERQSQHLDGVHIPNGLGKAFAAIVGAILMDTSYDISLVSWILNKHLDPLIKKFCDTTNPMTHPVYHCVRKIDRHFVKSPLFNTKGLGMYETNIGFDGIEKRPVILCTVAISGIPVVRALGVTRRQAKRIAAAYLLHLNVEIIRNMHMELRKKSRDLPRGSGKNTKYWCFHLFLMLMALLSVLFLVKYLNRTDGVAEIYSKKL